MEALRARHGSWLFAAVMLVLHTTFWQSSVCATETEKMSDAHSLRFVTEEMPPFNFDNKGSADGFGSDLVRELLRRENLSAPISVLPWPRAYKIAQSEANVGIYCMIRSPEREKQFQWVGPIGDIDSRIYLTQDSALHLNTLNDAKAAKYVIVLREGYHAKTLEKLGFTNLIMVNSPSEGLRLLLISGDRSLLLIPTGTIQEAMRRNAAPPDAIKPALNVMQGQLYIGFSLDTEPAVVSRLQHTLDAMKADGSFAALYQKWFPGQKAPELLQEPITIIN